MAVSGKFFPFAPQASGDYSPAAFDVMYQGTFSKLRSIAERLLSRERDGLTLQPTALVNESFLKLRKKLIHIENEDHFFHLSARAMRQVLIDRARVRGKWIRVAPESLPEALWAIDKPGADPDLSLALKITWERLRLLDSRAAQAIWMRCVEGKTIEEVSATLGRTPSCIRVDYEYGLKWMAAQLGKRT